MKNIKRKSYLSLWKEQSQEKEMVFLAGPRQAGKTTLTKEIAQNFKNNFYFNWDILSNKKILIKNPTFFENINRIDNSKPFIIFDEIHKYKNWKNYLKGIYDEFFQEYLFLISGSGRLDTYQKGGDSLAGRYLMFHLFPFTISELSAKKRLFSNFIKDPISNFQINNLATTRKNWKKLFELSGFPEPFAKNKKTFWTKWTKNYTNQIIREDIRDISNIKNVNNVEILFSLLPSKVGSPISVNNLANDIQIANKTAQDWLNLFDTTYLTFKLSPWTKKISRAITKEKKIYLFNYPIIQEEGERFENMVAVELYRIIHYWNESGYGNFKLHYIRNKEKEEVDFAISNNNAPIMLIETKNSDTKISKSLINFQNILNIPAIQLVNKQNIYRIQKNNDNKILVATADQWLSSLPENANTKK
ncbi:ATP-binding protein [Candidatus Parcubacteria bacterium]|nr:ATP-binding protein [Candidatus Parcubacteria bacterium]